MSVVSDVGSLPLWRNKWFWIIIGILIIAYCIYKYGSNTATQKIQQATLTGGTQALPPASEWTAAPLGDSFGSDFAWNASFNPVGRQMVADINALAALPTPTMVQAVYNYYNATYQQSNAGLTLTQAIAAQYGILPDFMTGLNAAQKVAAIALQDAGCAP